MLREIRLRQCILLISGIAYAILGSSALSGAAEKPRPWQDGLIEDVLPYYRARTQPSQSEKGLEELRRAKPQALDAWKDLRIGEFETDKQFRERQRAAREAEQKRDKEQLEKWNAKVKSAADRLSILKSAALPTPTKVARDSEHLDVPTLTLNWSPPASALPYFDREAMSFTDVQLVIPPQDVTNALDKDVLARFTFQNWENAQFVFSSLEQARDFKADFRDGKAKLAVVVKPALAGWEDPIIVSSATTGIEFETEPLIRNLIAATIMAVSKKELQNWRPEPFVNQVPQAAKTRPGVRFHFVMVVLGIHVLDSNGNEIKTIQIRRGTGNGDPASASSKTFTNSIGMRFALMPTGEFVMGPPEQYRTEYDANAHPEVIAKPYYIGIHEVTNEDYLHVMRRLTKKGSLDFSGDDPPKYPVRRVSWFDAVRFCDGLSALPAEAQAGRKYRLPNEAEWEYACRAGTTTAFNTGKELSSRQANIEDKLGRPERVGTFPPNDFGLYDMHGNVMEWCMDKVGKNGSQRPLKGGDWSTKAKYCLSGQRFLMEPGSGMVNYGFRVVCDP